MNPDARPAARERVVHAARLLGLAVAYVASGTFGLSISPVSGFATLVWPPSGLALAALLLGGCRLWPAIAVGAFLTNLWAGAPPLVACGIAAGNTLEAVGAALALRRVPGFQPALHRFTNVVALAALGGLVSTTLSASIGVASLALGGVILPASISHTWLVWWTGDLVGVLIVAPALLTWSGGWRGDVCRATPMEAAWLGAFLLACTWVVFGTPPGAPMRFELLHAYILFLPLIWAALRFGTRGAATAVLVTAVVAVAGTYTGRGPFVRAAGTIESLVALHVFLSTAWNRVARPGRRRLRARTVAPRGGRARSPAPIHPRRGSRLHLRQGSPRPLRDHQPRRGTPARGAAEAVIGKDDGALFPAAEARTLRREDVDVVLTGAPPAIEEPLTIAGEPRVYLTTKTPHRDLAGRVLGVIGIARDITERKNGQRAGAPGGNRGVLRGRGDRRVARRHDHELERGGPAALRLRARGGDRPADGDARAAGAARGSSRRSSAGCAPASKSRTATSCGSARTGRPSTSRSRRPPSATPRAPSSGSRPSGATSPRSPSDSGSPSRRRTSASGSGTSRTIASSGRRSAGRCTASDPTRSSPTRASSRRCTPTIARPPSARSPPRSRARATTGSSTACCGPTGAYAGSPCSAASTATRTGRRIACWARRATSPRRSRRNSSAPTCSCASRPRAPRRRGPRARRTSSSRSCRTSCVRR